MSSVKRFRAPLVVMFGMTMTVVAFAGPAQADDAAYPPAAPQVLGNSASSDVPVGGAVANDSSDAGASEGSGAGELAFTGATAIGAGAFGGLLLVGGTALVFGSKRRKVDA